MTRIGFVGAGRLGEPMVERLLAAGHEVVVFARREDVRARMKARGAALVDDAAAAGVGVEVFLSCLFADDQLQEVAPAVLAAMPAGSVFASHTTGSVARMRQLATQGRARKVAVVDAPVSGTDVDIRSGNLTVLLGGEVQPVAACADAVGAYASRVVSTGPLGSALAAKLVNNLLFAAQVQLVVEALHLARELGVQQATLLEVLQHCSGGSAAAGYIAAAAGDVEVFGNRVAPFLSKDVAACRASAAELGVDPALLLEVVRSGRLPIGDVP